MDTALTRRRLHVACRVVFVAIIVASAIPIVQSAVAASSDETVTPSRFEAAADVPYEQRSRIVPPRSSTTVVTSAGGWMVALSPDGRVRYYETHYDEYFDVDPVAPGSETVVFVAGNEISTNACESNRCTRVFITRLNVSTGERTVLFRRAIPTPNLRIWHDVDRVGESEFLVADIHRNRVFIVNTTTELTTWEWDARSEFRPSSGGIYPDDWTHLNDVEQTRQGIMVSLRNQDQVVFIDRETGLRENWTLGEDDNRTILFEQHNPDYIPRSEGGPAVVVADSENNRVVEYQRRNGSWERTWTWADPRLQWPRDADRLPNGHTLVTDTNGDRIVEVDEAGNVTWALEGVNHAYDAERLATGDESRGGPSAVAADLRGREAGAVYEEGTDHGWKSRIWVGLKGVMPNLLFNALAFVLPPWLGPWHLISLAGLGAGGIGLAVSEYYFSPYRVRIRLPVVVRKD